MACNGSENINITTTQEGPFGSTTTYPQYNSNNSNNNNTSSDVQASMTYGPWNLPFPYPASYPRSQSHYSELLSSMNARPDNEHDQHQHSTNNNNNSNDNNTSLVDHSEPLCGYQLEKSLYDRLLAHDVDEKLSCDFFGMTINGHGDNNNNGNNQVAKPPPPQPQANSYGYNPFISDTNIQSGIPSRDNRNDILNQYFPGLGFSPDEQKVYYYSGDGNDSSVLHGHQCSGGWNMNQSYHEMENHVRQAINRFDGSGWGGRHPLEVSQILERNRRLGAYEEINQRSRAVGDPVAFQCDNSFIIQGRDVNNNYGMGRGYNGHFRGSRRSPFNQGGLLSGGERASNYVDHFPLLSMNNVSYLAQCPGYMSLLARDQNGCRQLQTVVAEGSPKDVLAVFEGIKDDIVELMMEPFGNYLVQKLLDVLGDEQKLQIVDMVTKEQGQLVRISLNTHGTRVIQKLIEKVQTRRQICLVKSALQSGFIDLIRDLNGNHVIQRCLSCFDILDNEFIFNAATKYCVDIATHEHGCCVLQRCIEYSVGNYRDRLVAEICKHALRLAQDPYGNYVVQYVIEMEIPSVSAKMCSQFKGNYVSLSMQKCSSHVVEKCLKLAGDSRSRIVRELLSTPQFDLLLQHPYANYVIGTALAVTKGAVHASLVEAIRPHKSLRTNPHCKRIFSGNHLKK